MRRTLTVMAALAALVFSAMAASHVGEDGQPTITSPTAGEHILSTVVQLSGVDVDEDVRWAVRASSADDDPTCIAETDVAGNVRGLDDAADIDEDGNFSATLDRDALDLADGEYCFSLNQGEPGTPSTERAFVFFYLSTPDSKDACKNGGWEDFTDEPGPFRNQGQCVSYFASDGKSAK